MSTVNKKILGIVAQFAGTAELIDAAVKVKAAGFSKWDCHSPFPIHGMDKAMGEKRSNLGWIVGACAIIGGSGALWLQGWSAASAYPHVISGKALFSYQAFFPITFAVSVLFAAFGTLFGLLGIIKVQWNHPLFESKLFPCFSDDGFLVHIEADDPQFDPEKTKAFLKSIGAGNTEIYEKSE
jgi:hypothetical protein